MRRERGSLSYTHPAFLIATYFGVGKIPILPSMWGSVAGIATFLLLSQISYSLVYFFAFVLFFAGSFAAEKYGYAERKHDSPEVVADEVVGQILTIGIGSLFVGAENLDKFAFFVTFIAFRVFDTLKPPPVRSVDMHVKGGIGVMLDDVVAAVYAGLASGLVFLVIYSGDSGAY